jgi:hypothetical protein
MTRKRHDSEGPFEQPALNKTEQLVADLIAADGRLVVRDLAGRELVNLRQRAYSAQRRGRIPAGKHVRVRHTPEGLVIELLDGQSGNELGAPELPVPEHVARYHHVAREFRDHTSLHEVSREQLPRVLRIIHAIVVEAERRGWSVRRVPGPARDGYSHLGLAGWKPSRDGQLIFEIPGGDPSSPHRVNVRISEKGVEPRIDYEQRLGQYRADREKFGYQSKIPTMPKPYDRNATGQIDVAVLGRSGRQSSWGDRHRWTVEDRLPQMMRELEARAADAEAERLARQRRLAEERHAWEVAMVEANRKFLTAHQCKIMLERSRSWREAEELRSYCNAVEARHGPEAIAAEESAKRWLEMVRAYADQLQELPVVPARPRIRPDDLKPYLGGLSPHGPKGS